MTKLIRALAWSCLLLAGTDLAHAQGWRGIVPLHSKRQDVERVLGVTAESNGITYVLKDKRVNVVYSKGKCGDGRGVKWNVPPDTVLGITIHPQIKLPLSDIRADLSDFEKFVNPRDPDTVYYNNDEEGISIGARSGGEVFVIQYLPTPADSRLRCQLSPPRHTGLGDDEPLGRKFDEYSNISFEDERFRLDNLALALQREPTTGTYIVSYAGRHTSAEKARSRAKRAKNYLTGVHKIEEERIMIKFGGRRKKAAVELYISVRGDIAPAL